MSAPDTIETRIRELMSEVLEIPAASIGPDTSRDTAATWTSLNHLMLISQIEGEFGLMLSNQEIHDLTSFGRIVETLIRRQSHGA